MIPLSEICDYSTASTDVKSLTVNNYITTDNLLPNRGGVVEATNLPPAVSCPKFAKDNILLSNIRPYFKKIWYATFDGGCSTDVLVLKCKNQKYHPKYVYYSLFQDLFFRHMMNGAKGSKMPRGDKDQIMEFEIPDFEKQYQIKIADLLSALDAKISLNNRINAELEQMARTLYNYWFVQFDFPISAAQAAAMGKPELEGKPYKASGGEMVWNEELKREVPRGWEVQDMGLFCEIIRGITYNNKDVKKSLDKGAVPILRATNISNGVIDLDDLVFVPSKLVSSNQILNKFDILITMSSGSKAHVGKSAFYYFDNNISYGAFCSKILLNKHMKFYINNHIQSQSFKKYITNICLGTNINNLTNSHLINNRVLIPGDEHLSIFENTVESLYNRIGNNLKENQELTRLRDFLLPLLMNGQVRVE
jgi:type I restriction enzyme, S subunit